MKFRVISGYDATIWYESSSYSDCQEYIRECSDVASEKELYIEETN